jgi:hypothetical protein
VASFLSHWAFNTGPYRLIVAGLNAVGLDGWSLAVWPSRALLMAVLLLLAWALWRGVDRTFVVFGVLASVVWFGATVNPWYLIWALPFAALIGCWPWLVLTGLCQLSYVFYFDQVERPWLMWIEHGGFALVLLIWLRTIVIRKTSDSSELSSE